jgi:thymidylate synthase|tara:strand:- start:10330 stop:10764 length:435 start_codon:yes stop_codon:yes gene_type:complete
MNIDEIMSEWKTDSEIDVTELADESIKIAKLHQKYYEYLIKEKLLFKKNESDLKLLRLEKYEFYTQGHNEETLKKGWELPSKGMVIKSEIPMYLEGDKDIINLNLKISYQQEKIDLLQSIIKSLNNRGYNIKSAIDWIKFTSGV